MGDSLPPAWSRVLARYGFKPGEFARYMARFCERPGILRDFLEMPPPGGDDRELVFAAMLIALRVRPRPVAWPDAGQALGLLLLMLAARCDAGPHLTPGGGDLTRIQSAPLAHARATLTAAPPARVPCPAGATG